MRTSLTLYNVLIIIFYHSFCLFGELIMAIKLSLKHFLGFKDQLFLLALPILFVASELWVRIQGGPNWLWFNLDPDYFYLLDALNILNC